MPLVSPLGEQSLNFGTGGDYKGGGLSLFRDSDHDLFGVVQQLSDNSRQFYAFYVEGDGGQVSERVLIGEDTSFLVYQYDQDAFVFVPEDNASFGPTRFQVDSGARPFEGSLEDYSPSYRLTADGLLRYDTNQEVGQATQTTFSDGTAVVYTASDGDGSGIFLRVTDSEGHTVGGVVRVNDVVRGNQIAPTVGAHDEAFTVAWTQSVNADGSAGEYRATTFNLRPNLGLALNGQAGNQSLAGDKGDYVTDILFYNTVGGENLGHDKVANFGDNDILVTTSLLEDRNGDGIVNFGSNKRLDLTDLGGHEVGDIAFRDVRSLEFDGAVEGRDGVTYYVYSRVGSDADQHYLIV